MKHECASATIAAYTWLPFTENDPPKNTPHPLVFQANPNFTEHGVHSSPEEHPATTGGIARIA